MPRPVSRHGSDQYESLLAPGECARSPPTLRHCSRSRITLCQHESAATRIAAMTTCDRHCTEEISHAWSVSPRTSITGRPDIGPSRTRHVTCHLAPVSWTLHWASVNLHSPTA